MWNWKKQNKTKQDSENRLVVARGRGWGVDEVGEGGQKVQTYSL